MKKTIAMVVSIILTAAMTGCENASKNDTNTENNTAGNSSNVAENSVSAGGSNDEKVSERVGNVKVDPNMRFISFDNNFYGNGCIYYEDRARYLDFDTLESTPLCAKPNCNHNSSDCLAVMVGRVPVFYND